MLMACPLYLKNIKRQQGEMRADRLDALLWPGITSTITNFLPNLLKVLEFITRSTSNCRASPNHISSMHLNSAGLCKHFEAIAFDFDGTLVNTLHLHYEAYRSVFKSMGLELSLPDFYQNIGGKASEAIPLFLHGRSATLSIQEIHLRKKLKIAELFRDAPLQVFPAAKFLPLFFGQVPLALVSSGSRDGILQLLNRLGWSEFFKVIVCGDDTTKSKPDPMPYLLAAEKLGVQPSAIAVFEDTPAGLDAARLAGMSAFDVSGNTSFLWP